MKYTEEMKDLFTVPNDYYFAHCISADFALGAGIAVEFKKRFDMKNKLMNKCPGITEYMDLYKLQGTCLLIDNVFNLVTKRKYWQKPTYASITQALYTMKRLCDTYDIKKIAMPKIGAGLDRLQWNKVSKIIKQVFADTDVEILVCKIE